LLYEIQLLRSKMRENVILAHLISPIFDIMNMT
jgi:hypothetical protein